MLLTLQLRSAGPRRRRARLGQFDQDAAPPRCDRARAYVPVDISGDFLRDSRSRSRRGSPACPSIRSRPISPSAFSLSDEIAELPKLGFFPGSTIGNMIARTAVDLLRNWRCALGDGSLLLIGIDRIKDVATLELAYDDPAGVTARVQPQPARRGSTASLAATFRSTISPIARSGTMFTRASKCISSRRVRV
jgi:L-histidine N-alpha-methyltransferase